MLSIEKIGEDGYLRTSTDETDIGVAREKRWITLKLELEVFVPIVQVMEKDRIYSIQLYMICFTLAQRYQIHDTPDELDMDRLLCGRALQLYPPKHPLRFIMLINLGAIIVSRLGALGDNAEAADLDEAIHIIGGVLPSNSQLISPTNRLGMTTVMARSLKQRFMRLHNNNDLDAAVKYLGLVANLLSGSDPSRRSIAHLELAITLQLYPKDNIPLDLIISHLRQSYSLLPSSDPACSHVATHLINYLDMVTNRTRDVAVTDEIANLHEVVLAHCAADGPSRWQTLVKFGEMRLSYFLREDSLLHLDAAHSYLTQALELILKGEEERAGVLISLGAVYKGRFRKRGRREDAELGVACAKEALDLTPRGHPSHWVQLMALSDAFLTKYGYSTDVHDLRESIRYSRASLEHLLNETMSSMPFIQISRCLHDHFSRHSGSFEEINEATEWARKSVALARKNDHKMLPSALEALARCLKSRYQQLGDMADLDNTINCHQERIGLIPPKDTDRIHLFCDLVTALGLRYSVLEDLEDIKEAIGYTDGFVNLNDPYHRTVPEVLATMTSLYAALEPHEPHIDQIISLNRHALEKGPGSGEIRAVYLMNLGRGLRIRGKMRNNPADFDEAMEHLREALSHYKSSRGLYELGLAMLLNYKFQILGCDIDEAISLLKEAETTPPDCHNFQSPIAYALASAYRLKNHPAEHEKIFTYLEKVVESPSTGARDRVIVAREWGQIGRQLHHKSSIRAYSTALSLLERHIMVSHTIESQHRRINNFLQTLHLEAASCAIGENHLEAAMELLEQGRAVLWSQVGRYRSALEQLSIVNSPLAAEFLSLSRQLERNVIATVPISDRSASEYRLQSNRWSILLDKIREEGFPNFLKSTPYSALQRAAVGGPVVVINIDEYRSDAIIIRRSSPPILIPLPLTTPSELFDLVNDLLAALQMEGGPTIEKIKSTKVTLVLRSLWLLIVQHVVDELRNTCELAEGSRVWWCPTSVLWSLPLHAAGPYRMGMKNLPDIFVSSYTPTLSALIRSTIVNTENSVGPEILLVGQGQTPGQASLPSVSEEIRQVQESAPSTCLLNGEAATRDAVLSSLQQCSWAHFACHGSQDLTRPFNSHFILHDNPLSLLDVIQSGLPKAEFAFLSACHSAAGDLRTPNEAIHLAAALQFSGFKSVIGTMWAMADEDGPVVARELYKYMFRNPEVADFRDAAVGLNHATKVLRRMKVPVARWINFIHIGA